MLEEGVWLVFLSLFAEIKNYFSFHLYRVLSQIV